MPAAPAPPLATFVDRQSKAVPGLEGPAEGMAAMADGALKKATKG
eukprot:SAG22_NODE_10771_length_517_cov_0.619617_1_plen_44_part_10